MANSKMALDHKIWPKVCFTSHFSYRFNENVSTSQFDLNVLVENLATYEPDLKELYLQDPRPFAPLQHEMMPVSRQGVSFICRLENLTKVVFEKGVSVELSGFLHLSLTLKNLKWVSGVDIQMDINASTMRRRLIFLKGKFGFHVYDLRNFVTESKLAIWLHTSQADISCITAFPKHFLDLHTISNSFPLVTRIELDFDDFQGGIDLAPSYYLLKAADLNSTNSDSAKILLSFLKSNGQSLRSLTLTGVVAKSGITLRTIFVSCPVLKQLDLQGADVSCDLSPVPYLFGLLQSFTWEMNALDADAYFARVLTAPNLQEFYIKCHNFDARLLELMRLVEQKQALNNIIKYRIESLNNDDGVIAHVRRLHYLIWKNFPDSTSDEYRSGNNRVFSFHNVQR